MTMTSCEEFLNELDSYVFAGPDAEICMRFRSHLGACHSCRKELMAIQEAMNFLPTELPDAPLRPDLKQKALNRIDFLESCPVTSVFNFDELKWEESDIPGVRFHWLRKDDSGTTAALLRIPPGHSFPNHRHVGAEDCLVLQGGFRDSRGQYERGDYLHYEAGSIQKDLQALDDEECVLYLVNQQGIDFEIG